MLVRKKRRREKKCSLGNSVNIVKATNVERTLCMYNEMLGIFSFPEIFIYLVCLNLVQSRKRKKKHKKCFIQIVQSKLSVVS